MKTKLAIALSVAGVLSAGSAAALVNTQILDGDDGSGDTVLAAPSTADAASTPSLAPSSTTATTLASRLTTFQVGEAGAVSVDLVDGRIVVPSAEPAAGWTVASIDESSDDGQIDVSFSNESAVVDLAVTLVGDQFVPQVRSTAVTTTTAVTSTTTPTTTPSTSVANTVVGDTVASTLVDNTVANAGTPTTSIDDHGGDDDNSGRGGDDDEPGDDHGGHGGGDDDSGRGRGRGGDDD